MAKLMTVSKNSRPWLITELIGRALVAVAGTLPLAKAIRGKVSDDPRVEEEFFEDGK
jgi:acylglycerol lipase